MSKIIHLLNTRKFSGAENMACQIIEMQKQENNEAYYCSLDGEIKEKINNLGINFLPLNSINYFELRKVIKKIKPDFIHAHDFKATVFAVLVAFGKNIKVISHIHSDFDDMTKITIKSFIYNFFSKKAFKIIWVSESAKERYYFKNNVKEKSIVLKNVINDQAIKDKINYSFDKNYDLIYVGRLEDVKNPLRFLSITKELSKTIPNIKLAVIGSGTLEETVRNYVSENNLSNNVELLGFLDNPYSVLNKSKLMIMTSKNEGLPMCILESFSCGVPVVSTAVGSIPNVVNERNGFCSNSDNEIIEFISNYLKNESFQIELKNSTLQYFNEEFSYTNYSKELIKIYNEE